MARRLVAFVAVLLLAVAGSASVVSAHGDEGEMTLTNAQQVGPDRVHVEVGIVYANDKEPAEEASVTATLTGPDGSQVGPIALPVVRGSLYGADVDVSSPGAWSIAVSSTTPAAEVAGEITVSAEPTSSTSSTTSASAEGSETAQAPIEAEDDESSIVVWLIVAAILVVLLAGAVVYAIRRSRRAPR